MNDIAFFGVILLIFLRMMGLGITINFSEDIEYLEKAFKKWTSNMLSSPYIPTPSLLINPDQNPEHEKKQKKPAATKPSKRLTKEKYKEIIDFLHKGPKDRTKGKDCDKIFLG